MSVRDFLYHPVSGKTNNLLLFVVALVPAFVLFSFPASVFSNGIDPPLAWVFNFLIRGHLSLGRNIIFPHGPLAFLMYPLPTGSNLWIAVIVHLILRIFLAYNLLKLATRKPIGYMVFALVSSFVLLAVNDILLTIVQIIILCYLNFFERRNILWLLPALIITPLALYIKAFVGIISLVITISFAGIMIFRMITGLESWYRLLLFLIVPFVLLLAWLGLYGDVQGIGGYLHGMWQLAADNSAAVAVYPFNNWWVIGIGLISGLVLIGLNIKNTTLVRFTILAGPAMFAIWKYGMAREDYLHTSMMFVFILFTVLIYNILTGKFRILNSVLSGVIVVLFYLTLQQSYYFEPFHIKANGVQMIFTNAINYRYFADTCDQSSDKATERNKLDQRILDLIGNKTVDIYPWDYSYIAANNLNWLPRSVIQSYASYTSELDRLNARHLESDKAPEFIIWELRKITHDIHAGTLESIDGRYLLNDEPDALMAMLCNYELTATQKGIFPALVFKKRADSLSFSTKDLGKTTANWNTWIDVPGATSDILRASVDMERSLTGRLRSIFYKDEAAYVYYLLENGDIRMYRIVPKNAAYGLWINPLIINPEFSKKEPAVKKIMFRCSNTAMMKDKIDIKWEELTFSQINRKSGFNTEVTNPVSSFFGITDKNLQPQILLSENNLETNNRYWVVPDGKKFSITDGNHTLNLFPNEYSVSFEYQLDSIEGADSTRELIVRSGVWAKAKPTAKAVYVISIEKDGKSLLWKAVDIDGFLHDQRSMNFVTNYSVLDKELLQQKGLTLNVYVWNTGKDTFILDDFSVRIERQ
jgi:hypothetical protein